MYILHNHIYLPKAPTNIVIYLIHITSFRKEQRRFPPIRLPLRLCSGLRLIQGRLFVGMTVTSFLRRNPNLEQGTVNIFHAAHCAQLYRLTSAIVVELIHTSSCARAKPVITAAKMMNDTHKTLPFISTSNFVYLHCYEGHFPGMKNTRAGWVSSRAQLRPVKAIQLRPYLPVILDLRWYDTEIPFFLL